MTEQNTKGQGGKRHGANAGGPLGSLLEELPTDRLKSELEGFLGAAVGRGVKAASEKLTGIADGGGAKQKALSAGAHAIGEGESPVRALTGAGLTGLKDKVSQAFGGGGSKAGGGAKVKVTNIVEQIDVGVPVQVVYNQWTQFRDFPSFMKKVENVDQEEDEKLTWRAQVLWSHRSWTSTILEQIPDKRIVWRSDGDKGSVDGAVTFHELAPELTRVVLVLEYHPKGLFEHTGNLWRAQGRRVRLELKHFQRHVMSDAILHAEEIEGWRGEIRDGQVVREHGEEDEPGPEGEEEPEDAHDEYEEGAGEEPEEAHDEYEEGAGEELEDEEYDDEELEDIDSEYGEPAGEELEEEPLEDDEEDAPADEVAERRRRATAESR